MVGVEIKIPIWLEKIFVRPVMIYRRWKHGYTFRRIYLGEGEYTIVDPDVYYRLGHFKWFLVGNKRKMYAGRSIKTGPNETKIERLHRVIMNAGPEEIIDHRDGNSMNNRVENLRPATHSQNNCNVPKRKNTSSQYKGVYFDKRRERWMVYIKFKGEKMYVGSFVLEIEAACAYDRAAIKYHGEFARLNFSEENATTPCLRLTGAGKAPRHQGLKEYGTSNIEH
jgi:hypothetical protein